MPALLVASSREVGFATQGRAKAIVGRRAHPAQPRQCLVAIAMARHEPAPKVKAIAGVDASRLVLRHFAGSLGRTSPVYRMQQHGVVRGALLVHAWSGHLWPGDCFGQ
jgi:hypothetical protein